VVLKEPTSLNGGEGLVSELRDEVKGVEGEDKGEGGGGEVVMEEENERTSTRDGVDVCFKLCLPP
jgi:GTPase involved in cell partitioning and DNA repair